MKQRVFLLFLFLLATFGSQAQKLTVESFGVAPGDLDARSSETRRTDRNGTPCALVKVQLPLQGAVFDGVVGDVQFKAGVYWVYMPDGGYQLKISHPQFHRLDLNLRTLWNGEERFYGVEQLTTYDLIINVPHMDFNKEEKESMTFYVDGIRFKMIRVEGGTFQMGSNDGPTNEKPVHSVTISKAFYMGETEVTQALWQAITGLTPTANGEKWQSKFGLGGQYPVYHVSWYDCQAFINALNSKIASQLPAGMKFRLPTEEEWEYAARGGNKSKGYKYSGSNSISTVAWYWENSGREPLSGDWNWNRIINNGCTTHPVGGKQPNELGLYDMSGNVWEWCQDWYNSNNTHRVNRGGSWDNEAQRCRTTFRNQIKPAEYYRTLGLRLVLQ